MANNNALIAAGVGCAVISLCCVCGVGGYFVMQKGQQAGQFPVPSGPGTTTAPATNDAPVPAGPGFMEVRGDGFAYNVPSEWQEQSTAGVLRMHGSKEFPGRTINITSEPFMGSPTEYRDASVNGLRQQSQVTITGQRDAMIGTQQGFEIESDWTQGSVRVHLLQIGTSKNGKGFVLTCGDLAERFAAAQTECRAIFATFRVL
jgi:hypothetical protein